MERLCIEWVAIEEVSLNPRNPRVNDQAVPAVKASILRFGFRQPIVANRRTGLIEAGNARYKAARELGLPEIPVVWVEDDEMSAIGYTLADNRTHEFSSWDEAELAALLKVLAEEDRLEATGFSEADLNELLGRLGEELDEEERQVARADLFQGHLDAFDPYLFGGLVSLSVWDANAPAWLARKRALERDVFRGFSGVTRQGKPGMQRGGGLYGGRNKMALGSRAGSATPYASLFDPVLAEVVLTYYAPRPGSHVYDPFMGDVRAVMALSRGHEFTGVDIRAEQVEAVRQELKRLQLPSGKLLTADSTQPLDIPDASADLVFTCPPYYNLEVYSDLAGDISNAPSYEGFLVGYRRSVAQAARILKRPGFAVFVVGNLRNEGGDPLDFRLDTIRAFREAGLAWHDEIIYRQPRGTGPARAYCFRRHRRALHNHEYVLVFRKGELEEFERQWERAASFGAENLSEDL